MSTNPSAALYCHVLLGCDTIAKLSGIGKATALKILNKGRHYLESFTTSDSSTDSVVPQAILFLASCYDISALTDAITNMSEL